MLRVDSPVQLNMRFALEPVELFGEEFVAHFAGTREWECRQHAKAVTDFEYKRYFEII
jgi:glutamine synthetase